MPTPFLINDTSPTIDDRQRAKVLKSWEEVDHAEVFRVVAGNAQRTRQGIKKEGADTLDDVLAKAFEYIDKHVDEHGPATYMVSFKDGNGKVVGSIFTNAGMEEAPTAEQHHTQSIAAYARSFNSTLDAVSRREQVLTMSMEKVGSMLTIAADATAKAVDAQIRIAELRFDDAKDQRDREDRRAESAGDMERLRMGVALAQQVLVPLVPGLVSFVQAKAAQARGAGAADAQDAPGEGEGAGDAPGEGAPGEGAQEAQDTTAQEARSSEPAQEAQPPQASAEPVDPGEPEPAAPKRRKKVDHTKLSPLASQTAGLLAQIKPAERKRLIAAAGEDVWSCVEAAAEQTEDEAAIAVYKKMKELRKDMPQAARDRMTQEIADVLGKLRTAEFFGILVQAGVN